MGGKITPLRNNVGWGKSPLFTLKGRWAGKDINGVGEKTALKALADAYLSFFGGDGFLYSSSKPLGTWAISSSTVHIPSSLTIDFFFTGSE